MFNVNLHFIDIDPAEEGQALKPDAASVSSLVCKAPHDMSSVVVTAEGPASLSLMQTSLEYGESRGSPLCPSSALQPVI